MYTDNGKRHLIPQFLPITKANHHPLRRLTTPIQGIAHMSQPALLLPEYILFPQSQETCEGKKVLGVSTFCQVLQPVLQLYDIFFIFQCHISFPTLVAFISISPQTVFPGCL